MHIDCDIAVESYYCVASMSVRGSLPADQVLTAAALMTVNRVAACLLMLHGNVNASLSLDATNQVPSNMTEAIMTEAKHDGSKPS